MKAADFVTVVIPCYNQAHFLSEAIESVLGQTHTPHEIIVVDDGSLDHTAAVAERYGAVRLLRQSNQGLAAARNAGLAAAQGRYISFLDADDRLLPEALERGLSYLTQHSQAVFAYGRYRNIAVDGTPRSPSLRPCVEAEHYRHLLRVNYIGMHATVLYRRNIFEEVGGFNERLRACEDYELYLRITRRFSVGCYPELVAEYRQHGTNMTHNKALMLQTAIDVLNAQRRYIKGNTADEQALTAGINFWQTYFGDKLMDEVIHDLRARNNWRATLRRLLVLASYYPQGLGKRVAQKGGAVLSSGRANK